MGNRIMCMCVCVCGKVQLKSDQVKAQGLDAVSRDTQSAPMAFAGGPVLLCPWPIVIASEKSLKDQAIKGGTKNKK